MRLAPELQFARGDLLDAKVAAPAEVEPDELDDEADDVETETDTAETDTAETDTAETDTAETDTAETGTAETDTAETDTAETDTAEPDTAEPDTAEPDTAEPDTAEPDTAETDTAETDTVESDTVESDTVESDTVESDTAETVLGNEPTADTGAAGVDEPAAETASGEDAEQEPAAEPGARAEVESGAVPEPELAEMSAPEADDEADAEPKQTSESKAESKADGEPEPEPEPEPETEATAPARRGPASVFRSKRTPVRAIAPESPAAEPATVEVALSIEGLSKYFGGTAAVDSIDLEVAPGAFFGIVGPNGAGKTTTLSMITGLLRPDSGVVRVFGADVWRNAQLAKRKIGVLPDRLRLFDRLTGSEFLFHAGALRGLDRATIAQRSADLSAAFGLEHSLHRLVSDYSVGMTKKIAIAAAMIHAPRLLVLDEPFESVDPVSVAVVIGVLKRFTAAGGTVILSSHSMELTERVCDGVAIIADGAVLAAGPLDEVLQGQSLEERFVELAGGEAAVEDMEWLQNFSD